MSYDIETVIQDNIRLKKSLQMCKLTLDKTEREFKQLTQLYNQSQDRNKSLTGDYCQLQKKYQGTFTQNSKEFNSLLKQIEQLKQLVESKQRQIQHIQIKMIPTLDQDMLRIKLISQMQGPYQQTVQKKDFQIARLKEKSSSLQRKLQISELTLKSKTSNLKSQLQQAKKFLTSQNQRLMKQLNIAYSRNQMKSLEVEIIKKQKKQLQQLRATIDFMQGNQKKLQDSVRQLKEQRNYMLNQISSMNQKQALHLQYQQNLKEISSFKQEKQKLENQNYKYKTDCERLEKRISMLQGEKKTQQTQFKRTQQVNKNNFEVQKQRLKQEVDELKSELKRIKSSKFQEQGSKNSVHQQNRRLQADLREKTRQVEDLRIKLIQNQSTQTNYSHFQKEKIIKKEKQNRQTHNIIRRQVVVKEDKNQQQVSVLKKTNQKLKKKLQEANAKIMALLKEKITHKDPAQRDRSHSNIQPYNGVFLQYQDCSFKPLVEPTLFTYTKKR